MIHENSLTAYVSIAPELTKRQKEVLEVFRDGELHTDIDVARKLGLEINQVTGRIAELIKKGELVENGQVYVNGRPRRLCELAKYTLF